MAYVFDTSSFIVAAHFFPGRFVTFWDEFNDRVTQGNIFSVREVRTELLHRATRQHLLDWVKSHADIFRIPTEEEAAFVAEIFAVPQFQSMVRKKQILEGSPVADPFVIASAKINAACVVTEESSDRPSSARIPTVCAHFGVDCTNLEGFMEREGLQY